MDCTAPITGLILSGGGARAAYQVGVLQAIHEMLPSTCTNPFPVMVGTSAGALNAAALACGAQHFGQSLERLARIWSQMQCEHIYRTDWLGVLAQAKRFVFNSLLGFGKAHPVALLDNSPLAGLLSRELDTDGIISSLRSGALKAFAITAFDYQYGQSVSFYQARHAHQNWRRYRREGIATRLSVSHLLASAAIPLLFAPVEINGQYYGDGALRQLAPISPALRLGATQVLIIGVNSPHKSASAQPIASPSLAQISGQLLNSAFIDNLEADIEVLERLNKLARQPVTSIEPVKVLSLSPSVSLEDIATRHRHELPRSIRTFIKGSGATDQSGGSVLSYLLFSPGYCQALMALGYTDAKHKQAEIEAFFRLNR